MVRVVAEGGRILRASDIEDKRYKQRDRKRERETGRGTERAEKDGEIEKLLANCRVFRGHEASLHTKATTALSLSRCCTYLLSSFDTQKLACSVSVAHHSVPAAVRSPKKQAVTPLDVQKTQHSEPAPKPTETYAGRRPADTTPCQDKTGTCVSGGTVGYGEYQGYIIYPQILDKRGRRRVNCGVQEEAQRGTFRNGLM